MRFQAEALRFQRDAAATGEWIQQGRRIPLRRDADQLARLLHDGFVRRRFPSHQPLDEIEEAHAGRVAFGFHVGSIARQVLASLDEFRQSHRIIGVVNERGENDRPRCCQRTPRPPQMQGRGVAVTDGFLARAGSVDGVQRQGNFDQFFGWGHGAS